jgi:hypothetical protein
MHVSVGGAGTFAGADNGKQDDADGYKSTTHDAFNGLMLAIAQASTRPGPIHVTVTSPGLRGAEITLHSSRHPSGGGRGAGQRQLPRTPATPAPGSLAPTADASFSGGVFSGFGSDFGVSTTLPATMLDGDPSTFWSNRYSKVQTQNLNAVTNAHPQDWVSVTWAPAKQVSSLQPSIITDANDELPAAVTAGELRRRVEHAVHDHLRPGDHDRAQARTDQPGAVRPHDRQPRDIRTEDPRRELMATPFSYMRRTTTQVAIGSATGVHPPERGGRGARCDVCGGSVS